MRFKKAVKKATREVRKRQSEIVAVVQAGPGLGALGQAFDRAGPRGGAHGRGEPGDGERGAAARAASSRCCRRWSAVVVALCTAFVLWRGTALILAGVMTVGALTVFLAYLSKFFKPVQDLAKMTNTIAQTAVGLERIQTILDDRR